MSYIRNWSLYGVIAWLLTGISVQAQPKINFTMQFYLKNIDSVMAQKFLFESSSSYSFKVRSIYDQTDFHGAVKKSDTALYDLKCEANHIKSVTIMDSAKFNENKPLDSLGLYQPWEFHYFFYFYPNDTGAGELSIGYEPQSPDSKERNSGLFVLDRGTYYPSELLIDFGNMSGYKRYVQHYRFGTFEGQIMPVRLVVSGTVGTIMGYVYFRRTLEFYDYRIGQ